MARSWCLSTAPSRASTWTSRSCSPADVGWKALTVAVSDLAAMGASPAGGPGLAVRAGGVRDMERSRCGVMAGWPRRRPPPGARRRRRPHRGGRTGGGRDGDGDRRGGRDGGVACGASAGRRAARHRSAGRLGGGVACAPGWVGARAAGPGAAGCLPAARRPGSREGETARRAGARAMIDVSDGLALDLHRLADASGLGFVLDDVPVAPGATLDEALGGGEDYELVIAVGRTDLATLVGAYDAAALRRPVLIGSVGRDPVRAQRWRGSRSSGWASSTGWGSPRVSGQPARLVGWSIRAADAIWRRYRRRLGGCFDVPLRGRLRCGVTRALVVHASIPDHPEAGYPGLDLRPLHTVDRLPSSVRPCIQEPSTRTEASGPSSTSSAFGSC